MPPADLPPPMASRYALNTIFDQAQVIVSLDADFLGPTAPNARHNAHAFAQRRRLSSPSDAMSRLYVVESTYSTTGSLADHRQRRTATAITVFANSLAAELGVLEAGAGEADPAAQAVAQDLLNAGTAGLVLAGEHQPAAVHALCAAINSRLGAIGNTVTLFDPGPPLATLALPSLVDEMDAGTVDVLLMLGVNPAYDAPPSLNFGSALTRVGTSIPRGTAPGRNRADIYLARSRSALPGSLGRRPCLRWYAVRRAAAHCAALRGRQEPD